MKPAPQDAPKQITCPYCRLPLNISHRFSSLIGPNGEPVVSVLTFCRDCGKPIPCSIFPVPMVPRNRLRESPAGLILPQ